MSELESLTSPLARPYTVTRSRLGATTKVYSERYVCDIPSLVQLHDAISQKLSSLPVEGDIRPTISTLISFSDNTHVDGSTRELFGGALSHVGKTTERVVFKWTINHLIDGQSNELSITVRVSNPVNPFVFFQAALSKSPNEIDNMEFELGSTCVTVDGATQYLADEFFLRVKNWIDARNKAHKFLQVSDFYKKHEWWIDQLVASIMPLVLISCLSIALYKSVPIKELVAITPVVIAFLLVLHGWSTRLTVKMSKWALKADSVSMFKITNGDEDAFTRSLSRATNSTIKLFSTAVGSLVLNVVGGIACAVLLKFL